MTKQRPRLPLIDTLKAGASQLIVLHHLAFYGPMSDLAYPLAPATIDWLYDYARIAVQVFLVVAGFLAARSLAPTGQPRVLALGPTLLARYCRLALPLMVAVLASILSAAIARNLLASDAIPLAPTLVQLLSHALLLQGVLDHESLSAGVWYVAIDFQLFAVLGLTLAVARRHPRQPWLTPALVATAGVVSLFYFNRQPGLDDWWMYFFGAYALGACAQWAGSRKRSVLWLVLMAGIGLAAEWFDFRSRIAIALATALLLAVAMREDWLTRWPDTAVTRWLARISYSVFLIHFPVCLLCNALIFRLFPASPALNLAGMALAWLASLVAGHFFHQHVELRCARLVSRRLEMLPSAPVRTESS
ncbi:MAG: acyltransferase [Candidatus Dactylopiibacterium sp.]|nr:acyltransferase [Candidatus Dactylopiibacterium sp.]